MCYTEINFAKQGNGLPTIPTTENESQWLETDVHDQELYFDTNSEQLFQRVGDSFLKRDCCPKKKKVVLDKSQVNDLNILNVDVVIPPINGSGSFGVRTACAPMLHVDSDGTPFMLSSVASLELRNGASSFSAIASFPSQCVSDGRYSGSLATTISIETSTQSAATVSLSCTGAITGGGPNATMILEFWYFLEN